jgi:hypothetical protein
MLSMHHVQVRRLTATAIQHVDDIAAANKAIDEGSEPGEKGLFGIGPAAASAIMSLVDTTGGTAFFSDEAMVAAGFEKKYTRKVYLQVVEALQAKAAQLNSTGAGGSGDSGGGSGSGSAVVWTAEKVERALWSVGMLGAGAVAGSGGGGGGGGDDGGGSSGNGGGDRGGKGVKRGAAAGAGVGAKKARGATKP